MDCAIYSDKIRFFSIAIAMAVVPVLAIAPPLFADQPPARDQLSFDKPNFQTATPLHTEPTPAGVFGNYAGAGKCTPGSPKSCTDTGVMDNVFIQPFVKPETDEQKQLREFVGQEKTDARVAIRILRDHGHSCTFEGKMFWSKDHLEFQDKPPAARTVYSKCQMQLLFKDGAMTIKDPGNECAEKYCAYGKPPTLAGRRFQKGPDQLLAAYKKSVTPPPASIFGTYNGTGQCATDERKIFYCRENKNTDYIVIEPSGTGDARVVVGSLKRAGEDDDYFCVRDADVMWLGNHLVFVKERPDKPGSPYILQFWFKGDTVVARDVGSDHCGGYFQGTIFKKAPTPPGRDAQR